MKYGKRERISGIIIVVALLVIFVPFLITDPEPRESHPQPSLSVERPVDVPRQDVSDPVPPARLENQTGQAEGADGNAEGAQLDTSVASAPAEVASPSAAEVETAQQRAERNAAEAEKRQAAFKRSAATTGGDWAVQVGSFGKPDNASGLAKRLDDKGFPTYSNNPGDGMTRVYVGPYDTTETAEDVMATLKSEQNLQGLLIRTDR